MMKSRILVLTIIIGFLLTSTSSMANPGGEVDSNRDFTCGGSCHGDPSLSAPSDAVIEIRTVNTTYAGTMTEVEVSISGMDLSKNRLLGVFLLGSINGNSDTPSDYDWSIIQDPNGGSSNYVLIFVPESGEITINWVLLAPSEVGPQSIYVSIHHGSDSNPDNRAFLGTTEGYPIQIDPIPDDYPTIADNWVALEERIEGDDSPLQFSTVNTDVLSVEWRLAGEIESHTAEVVGADNEWQAQIPASLGDTRIEYRITASQGEYNNQMPWLSMDTVPPYFDGNLFGARLQSISSALIIIGFVLTMHMILAPRQKKDELDQTLEVETSEEVSEPIPIEEIPDIEPEVENDDTEEYNSRLIHSEDNPGWLWDPVESEWVADPNNPPGGDS